MPGRCFPLPGVVDPARPKAERSDPADRPRAREGRRRSRAAAPASVFCSRTSARQEFKRRRAPAVLLPHWLRWRRPGRTRPSPRCPRHTASSGSRVDPFRRPHRALRWSPASGDRAHPCADSPSTLLFGDVCAGVYPAAGRVHASASPRDPSGSVRRAERRIRRQKPARAGRRARATERPQTCLRRQVRACRRRRPAVPPPSPGWRRAAARCGRRCDWRQGASP